MKKTRDKVHLIQFTRPIRCNVCLDGVVSKEAFQPGYSLWACVSAAVDPVHLTEVATLFEYLDGKRTDKVYYNVPYSAFTFVE